MEFGGITAGLDVALVELRPSAAFIAQVTVSLRRSSLSWYRYRATMGVISTGGCLIHADLQCECWYVMSYSRYDGRSRRGIFVRYWYYASLPPLDGVVFTTCGTSLLVRGLEV